MANGISFWVQTLSTTATKDDCCHTVYPMFFSDHRAAIWHSLQPRVMRAEFINSEFQTIFDGLLCRSFTLFESWDEVGWAARFSFRHPLISSILPGPVISFFNSQRNGPTCNTDQNNTQNFTPNLNFCELIYCSINAFCEGFSSWTLSLSHSSKRHLCFFLNCVRMANGIGLWVYILPTTATKDNCWNSFLPMALRDHRAAIWHCVHPVGIRSPFIEIEGRSVKDSLLCCLFTIFETADHFIWAARLSFFKPMICITLTGPATIRFVNHNLRDVGPRTQ